jgi:hypothetical protein
MKRAKWSYPISMAVLFWVISMISNRVEYVCIRYWKFEAFDGGLIADFVMFALGALLGFAMDWYRQYQEKIKS